MVERFGQYELLEPLASGGMAKVYRAKVLGAMGFEKIVALKFMLPSFAANPDAVQMFVDEARLAATLSHANIVGILDFGERDGTYFIAMEHVAGANLRVLLRRAAETGRFPSASLSAWIIAEVARGLDYAHKKTDAQGRPLSIVHRDVSPQNIVASWTGEVKILDFGIASSRAKSAETSAGTIKGKYSYMSPEQASAAPTDHRSDVFSLGTVFYELLTRERAFPQPGPAALGKVRNAEFIPPEKVRPDLPEALVSIVRRAMARNAEDRFDDAAGFYDEVSRWLASERLRPGALYEGSSTALAQWAEALFQVTGSDKPSASPADAGSSSVLPGWESEFSEGADGAGPGLRLDLTYSASDLDEGEPEAPDGRGTGSSGFAPPPVSPEVFDRKLELDEPDPTAGVSAEPAPRLFAPASPVIAENPGEKTAGGPAHRGRGREHAAPSIGRADTNAGVRANAPPPGPTVRPIGRFTPIERPPRPAVVDEPVAPEEDAPRRKMLLYVAVTIGAVAFGGVLILLFSLLDGSPAEPEPVALIQATPTATPIATVEAVASPVAPEPTPTTLVAANPGTEPIGLLNLSSTPPNAEIWIDGKRIDFTPMVIPGLPVPQTYLVEVKKEEFADWSREVDILDDEAVVLVANLAPPEVPGKIKLRLPEQVTAYLDGKKVGTGPGQVTVSVQPGRRQLRLRDANESLLREYEILVGSGRTSEPEIPAKL